MLLMFSTYKYYSINQIFTNGLKSSCNTLSGDW